MAMNEDLRCRGVVEFTEMVDGRVQQRRVLDNVVTYAFRNEMVKWLAGQASNLPSHLALGAGLASATVNQKTVIEMVDEFYRQDLATFPQLLPDGIRYRSVFGATDIAGDISEAMLFDADAQVVVIDSLDVITGWSTGAGQVLSIEASDRTEGVGSLESSTSGAGPANLTFKKTTLSVDVSDADGDALQVWFYVDDASQLSGSITIQLSSSTTSGQDQWEWLVSTAGLSDGWNFLDLLYVDATITGSPDPASIVRFELTVAKTHPVTVRIDLLRSFQAAGNGLARVELSPPFPKQIGGVLNVTWSIFPDYEGKINLLLWEGDSVDVVAADVAGALVQTGSGTFPAVTGHPWTYDTMWLPAASGYMTGGRLALDSEQGSLAMWVRFGASEPANDAVNFDWREDSSNLISLAWNASSNLWVATYTKGGTAVTRTVSDTPTNNDYAFLVLTWGAEGLGLSLNGGARSLTDIASLINDILNEPTFGGGSGLVTSNLKFGSVLAFNRELADAEIASLYAINRKYVYGED